MVFTGHSAFGHSYLRAHRYCESKLYVGNFRFQLVHQLNFEQVCTCLITHVCTHTHTVWNFALYFSSSSSPDFWGGNRSLFIRIHFLCQLPSSWFPRSCSPVRSHISRQALMGTWLCLFVATAFLCLVFPLWPLPATSLWPYLKCSYCPELPLSLLPSPLTPGISSTSLTSALTFIHWHSGVCLRPRSCWCWPDAHKHLSIQELWLGCPSYNSNWTLHNKILFASLQMFFCLVPLSLF